jgi:hypothetical protein
MERQGLSEKLEPGTTPARHQRHDGVNTVSPSTSSEPQDSRQHQPAPSRDKFTRDQFDWLRQVAFDTGSPPVASRLAIALTRYFNREHDGWAWMSQAALARDLGIAIRTVRQGLAGLVDRGHLITKRRGKMETNLYHLALKNTASDRQESADHDRQDSAHHPPVTGKNLQSDRQESAEVTGRILPPNPLKEPTEDSLEEIDSPCLDLGDEDSRRRSRNPKSEIDADFESWWKQVPRKVAKAAAAKLYRRIVKNSEATPAQLMAGIQRYGAEVANREERFIAHPSTWLSQGRWADEPTMPVSTTTTIDAAGNPVAFRPPDRQQSSVVDRHALAAEADARALEQQERRQ